MKKQHKIVLWMVGVIAALPILVLFLIFPFAASNLIAGLSSLIFERRPSHSELVGTYLYKAPWGIATLALDESGKLRETLVDQSGSKEEVSGAWSYRGLDNYVDLDLRPFLSVQDEDHGHKDNIAGLPAFKPRTGKTYIEVNDDLGEKFVKQ